MEHRRHRTAEYTNSPDYIPEERGYGRRYSETPSQRRKRERDADPSQTKRPGRDRGREDGASADNRNESSRRRGSSSETSRRGNAEARDVTSAGPVGRRKTAEERKDSQRSSTGRRDKDRRAEPARKAEDAPTELSERSVNAAKKRKAVREENARLSRLREKQKRKAKRRAVKRIDKGLFKRIIIMAGVLVAVILSMVIFFRVETIRVQGVSYYSEEEILEACGVATGDNLLTLSRGEISGNIMAPLKYIDSVKVSRQLPNTLIIQVTESEPKYAVQDVEGNYFLMTAQGKIVEQISGNSYKEFTIIEGLRAEVPVIGEDVVIYVNEGEATKAKGQLTAMKEMLVAVEEAALGRHIASVQIPSAYSISLWYEDRFLVELGDTKRMDYKLEYLKAVIDKEESYVTGTIDLTLKDGDKAIVSREE